MKTLLILRHAKSSWKYAKLADYDRPLKKRGKRDCHKIGHLLRTKNLVPQYIRSSAAQRAHATAELVASACGYEGNIHFTRNFYAAGPTAYIEALRKLDACDVRVMVIGHNPGLEILLEALTGEAERLPTAALAQVSLPIKHWRKLTEFTKGKLINLWVPRQLR